MLLIAPVKEEFKVTQPDALAITKDVEKNISCFMGDNGTIEVTIDGGTLPYTYNWTTTNGSGIILNEKNQNTLTKGNYTLEVIDKNNCTISSRFALTESEEIKIDVISKNDILCFGDAAGSLEVDVSGGIKKEISAGVFDYVYNWSGPNGYASTSKNIDNLFAGTYTLNVIDDLGCTVNASFAVNQLYQIILILNYLIITFSYPIIRIYYRLQSHLRLVSTIKYISFLNTGQIFLNINNLTFSFTFSFLGKVRITNEGCYNYK